MTQKRTKRNNPSNKNKGKQADDPQKVLDAAGRPPPTSEATPAATSINNQDLHTSSKPSEKCANASNGSPRSPMENDEVKPGKSKGPEVPATPRAGSKDNDRADQSNGETDEPMSQDRCTSECPNGGTPSPGPSKSGDPKDKTKRDKEVYNDLLASTRAEISKKLKEKLDPTYVGNVMHLFDYAVMTAAQLEYVLNKDPPFFDDSKVYKGTSLDDSGPAATPFCDGTFRRELPQKRRTNPRVPTLIQAVIDGYNESYHNLIRGNGKLNNKHLHTSVLKRYMSAVIKANHYDAYPIIGQNWLGNTVMNGNALLTGAFIGPVLEDNADLLSDLKVPILAVVQDYTKGLHIGNEYSYVCDGRNVFGTSNDASKSFWTDRNINLPYSGEWHGMKVTTLMELGPQRLVFINHLSAPPAVFRDISMPDRAFEAKGFRTITINHPQMMIGLCDEIKDPEPYRRRLVGYDPYLVYRCYDEQDQRTPWQMISDLASQMWKTSYLGRKIHKLAKFLGLSPPDFKIVLNPNLCQFPNAEEDLLQLYYSNPIDPLTNLPFGVYKRTKNALIQLHFGDNAANWTNLFSLFRAYALRKGHSPASLYRELVDSTCALHPLLVPDSDYSFQPPYESPLQPITASRAYRVEVFEKAGMSVKLFSEQALREYVVNYVTHRTVSAAASWRVLRSGLRSRMPKGQMRQEYDEFWKAINGGVFLKMGRVDPLPDLSRYTGRKKRKYQYLLDTLGCRPIVAYYRLFCKMEALPLASVIKKAVRIISPNDPLFNLIALNFFVAFEEKLLDATSPFDTPYFAKRLNYEERFKVIQSLCKIFAYCYSIDFKNFDAHHCDDNYKQEIKFYGRIDLPKELVRMLLTARHSGVICYNALMRCSGDLFTGSGNCLTVGALLYPFVGKDFVFFCDGDDTLLFMNNQATYGYVAQHLTDRGYELGEPEIIHISRCKKQNLDYAIPFCQVEYHETYYCKDLDRLLNKSGNVAGSDLDSLSRTILGKLQSFPLWKMHGTKFNIDISKYLNGLDDDYELDYKKMLCSCMENYEPEGERTIDLRYGNSLIAQIARKFEYNKFRIYCTAVVNRKRLLTKLIREVLKDEYDRQVMQDPDKEELNRKIGSFVRTEGFAALMPVITDMYRGLVREHTDFEVLPPQTAAESQPLLLCNGNLYT